MLGRSGNQPRPDGADESDIALSPSAARIEQPKGREGVGGRQSLTTPISARVTPPRPESCRSAPATAWAPSRERSEEHTSELQSPKDLVCRLLLEKKKILE